MIRPWFAIAVICAFALTIGLVGTTPTANAQTFEEGPVYSDYLKQVGTEALDQIVTVDTRFTRLMWDVDRYRTVMIDGKFSTGFIYNDEGYIVTDLASILRYPSTFVSQFKPTREGVKTPSHIRVTFHDGKAYPAELIGYDTPTSLAVLKVDRLDPEYLSPVTFADSNAVSVGEPLAIVAHNFASETLSYQVTSGIIAALRTQYPALDETENIFFQVNFPFSPGNEGGIMLNLDGEMIAMLTYSTPYPDINEIHFALPENVIRDVVDQIIGAGEVRRAWFGFRLLDVSDELRLAYEIPEVIEIDYVPELPDHVLRLIEEGELETEVNDRGRNVVLIPDAKIGMFIINVDEDSPAEDAGLAADDILWMFQDKIIENTVVLNNELEKYDIGDIVSLTYLRRYFERFEVFTTEFEITFQAGDEE